ncbi:MAG: hypothetical protein JWQ30_1265 [Sediminibacterium sp.]|nr:hypothetical protein [Sediminibacterium sp.]
MKKLFIAATALLLVAGSLQAQTKKEDRKATHHKNIGAKKQFANVNLSDEQKTKAKELNEGYQKQFAELRKNTSMTVGDYRAKTAALKKEQHEKFQALLTPEQKTQMASQRKNAQQRMKDGQAKHFDKMKTQLGLSDEQSKKLKESQAGFQDKIKSIRENKELSEDQKREQVRAISKQHHEQLKSVLTPEQLQKMKGGRRGKGIQAEK